MAVGERRGVGEVGTGVGVEEESLERGTARKFCRCAPVVGTPGEGDRCGLAAVNAMTPGVVRGACVGGVGSL